MEKINLKRLIDSLKEVEAQKTVEEYLDAMLNETIKSSEELENWLTDLYAITDVVEDKINRDYSDFQCHNNDEKAKNKFNYDQEILMPLIKNYRAKLDKFLYENPYRKELPSNYDMLIKKKVNAIELFREENVAIEIEEDKLSTKYYSITGSMSVLWNGEEKTLQQMNVYLKDPDRSVREKAWKLVQGKRLQEADKLDDIMDELIQKRNEKAENAGFENFRDYMFKALERFDYTPKDCYEFHDSILKYVVPLSEKIQKNHMKELGISDYRPWDMDGVQVGQKPLKPYEETEDLINGVIRIFDRTDEFFAKTLKDMKSKGMLDLESRKAKSPGGYCTYYPYSKTPFIFMNGAHSQDDMSTLVHESGHSVHGMLCSDMAIASYRETPSESAELASMSMELISMDKWDEFYKNEEELKRAKREHLEGIIKFLPWAMTVDKFQHYLYLNPKTSISERNDEFSKIAKDFVYSFVDWTGFEENLKHRWKAQLHIFEVPFYYIEYAIAQLGALQIWRNYKENPKEAIKNYKEALALGSSKSLPEVYEKAGIKFDFSEEIIKELMEFTSKELEKLY